MEYNSPYLMTMILTGSEFHCLRNPRTDNFSFTVDNDGFTAHLKLIQEVNGTSSTANGTVTTNLIGSYGSQEVTCNFDTIQANGSVTFR